METKKLIIDQKVSWKKVIWFVALTYSISLLLCWFVYNEGKKLDPEYPAIKHFLEITSGDPAAVARYLDVHPEVKIEDLPTVVPSAGGVIELETLEKQVAVYVSQKHLAIQSFGIMMLFPALISIILRLVFKDGFRNSGFRFGKFKNYVWMLIFVVSFVFISIFANALIFGKAPDWRLVNMPTGSMMIMGNTVSPMMFWLFQFLVIGVIGNLTVPIIMMFGEEYGWRSYLLQKMLPMGFWKANILTGAIWGLWHAPVILMGYNYGNYTLIGVITVISSPGISTLAPVILMGYNYGNYTLIGVIMFTIVGILLGTIFNYMYIRGNSVILTSVGHGWFNGMVPSVLLLTGFMGKETIIAPLGVIGFAIMLILLAIGWKLTNGYDIKPFIKIKGASV